MLACAIALPATARAAAGFETARETRLETDPRGALDVQIEVEPLGEVELVLPAGRLEITGAEGSTLRVRGRGGSDLDGFYLLQAGRYTRLEARPPAAIPTTPAAGSTAAPDLETVLEVGLPATSTVRVRSMEADLDLQGMVGRLHVESLGGAIRVAGAPRSVRAISISGAIDLDVETPEAVAQTISGEITIDGEIEALRAETVDSALRVRARVGVESVLSTVTGPSHFEGHLSSTARLRSRVSSGPLHLSVCDRSPADLSIETVSGRLHDRRDLDGPVAGFGEPVAGRFGLVLASGAAEAARAELFSIEGDIFLEGCDGSGDRDGRGDDRR